MAGWPEQMVWWHVYPLGFTGAFPGAGDGAGGVTHRLGHLEAWLDYAVELGCNGLALGPIFASQTHGYDTVDYSRIDPRLGDDTDFDHLVAELRARGLRLLLDGVFNHVGRSFPRFAEALTAGPGSQAARWFRLRSPGGGGEDGQAEYDTFEGHPELPVLNHDAPEVADQVAEVMAHWLDRGADGWRLDAAYAVPPAFWRAVLPRVRERHPGAWFAGEMIHGDYAAYVEASGLDSVTQYELWKATWSSLNDGNFFELAWALDRHNDFSRSFLPLTFAGNHDVTRLASKLTDSRHLGHALAVLLTVAGAPSLYYGDEQAFRGVKEERVGGDDAIRPAFPATPRDLAPWGWPVYRMHQQLVAVRRRHPWLAHAHTKVLHLTNRTLAMQSTPRDGEDGLTVLLNLGDTPCRFPLDVGHARFAASSGEPSSGADPAVADPHGWSVLAT
jgi:cyclomaltodextrinase